TEARANIAAITANPAPPDFANTIEALELAEEALNRVGGVFWNLAGADSTPARQTLERELAPKMAAFSSEVTMNAQLFARIETLWQARAGLSLTREQQRVLELCRRMFVRAGAALDDAGRRRMAEVKERLAVLSTAFSQNVLAEERDWVMPLSEADLEGLPDFVEIGRASCRERVEVAAVGLTASYQRRVERMLVRAQRE